MQKDNIRDDLARSEPLYGILKITSVAISLLFTRLEMVIGTIS